MFVDQVILYCQAGDGGNGCSSFRREKYVPRGGPDGGDGGNGGSVVIKADRNLGSLTNLTGRRHWNAERGEHGKGALRTGRTGVDTVILVPPGTLVMDAVDGHLLKDLRSHEDRVAIAKGGWGGRGNKRFASSTHQAPRECEPGASGEYREVRLELKLIADVGLIGKPNAGKSTLLSRVSQATPDIAAYPFTTTYPNLGMVRLGYDHEYVLADIPGLIEGAHAGAGLGHEFLKHVERTRLLVHLVEPAPMDHSDPLDNYTQIRQELEKYNPQLAQRPEILCVTKAELPDAETCAELLRETSGRDVHLISAVTGHGIDQLHQMVVQRLSSLHDDRSPITGSLPFASDTQVE
ncbi:MAG: GTPase ObgE [Planctomycetaceae bacterium]|jgi:GTP-binding protein